MSRFLEVLFAPAEFAALAQRDLSRTTCVVFDVLRATSSMLTALANGAEAILPVADIPEALALKRARPEILLAGERHGLRIRREQTGDLDFELGNSPREFTADRVKGRTIGMTTTNGTLALRACSGAQATLVGAFLNLQAIAASLRSQPPDHLVVVCSGTFEEAALEDTLAAGALCGSVWSRYADDHVADSAQMARQLFVQLGADLPSAMSLARNGRRLLSQAELRDDVPFCLRRDVLDFIAVLLPDGSIRKAAPPRAGSVA
jgi:2-phosphosulfolactate phosphatase